MNYWWVNHKQTSRHELKGGYIWSPQRNSNGSSNQTYLNLTQCAVGDIVFSYSNTRLKAVGVVEASWVPAIVPSEFGRVGDGWSRGEGYLVRIEWVPLTRPVMPKDYLDMIVPLLPDRLSPIQKNGNGNQGCYLAALSNQLGLLLLEILEGENRAITGLIDQTRFEIAENNQAAEIIHSKIPNLEKEQIIKARTGQGLFRQNLFTIETHCRITGVRDPRFLIASHIKPWRDSNNEERISGNNGLLFSPHIDSLFDKAFISFKKSGEIMFADELTKSISSSWSINNRNIGRLNQKQQKFMEYHRDELFSKVADKTSH